MKLHSQELDQLKWIYQRLWLPKSEDIVENMKQLRVVMELFRVIATEVITHVCLLCLFTTPLLCINSSYPILRNSNSIILRNITFAHVRTCYFWALCALFVQIAAIFLLEKCNLASKLFHRKALIKMPPRTDSNHTTCRFQTISSCVI